MNKQREVLYGFRNEIINGDDPRRSIFEIIDEVTDARVAEFLRRGQDWITKLIKWANHAFPIGLREDSLPARAPTKSGSSSSTSQESLRCKGGQRRSGRAQGD